MSRNLANAFQMLGVASVLMFILAVAGVFGENAAVPVMGWSALGAIAGLIGSGTAGAKADSVEDRKQAEAKKFELPADPYSNAVGRMLLLPLDRRPPSGEQLMLSDGMLQDYKTERIAWREIWELANAHRDHIPPYGERPYWVPEGPGGTPFPLTQLAFYGTDDRRSIAHNRNQPEIIHLLLAEDPNPSVANSAKRSLN